MAGKAASEKESWWVLQAQSGSREALDELFKSVQEPLFRYIVTVVNDRHLAEDVLQEVFIRIYRKLRWLREPQAFRAWSYQIATREAFRYLKRERLWTDQVRDEGVLNVMPVAEPVYSPELVQQLPELVGDLSPASRAVIVLYYLHEMSLVETAAVLEIPVGTVKSRLAYGLESLRRRMEK
jgi:RNA polymerase sigma-70 factor (ECF subfamily)